MKKILLTDIFFYYIYSLFIRIKFYYINIKINKEPIDQLDFNGSMREYKEYKDNFNKQKQEYKDNFNKQKQEYYSFINDYIN